MHLNGDDRSILSRYVDLAQDLVTLTVEFDPEHHFDGPFQLSSKDVTMLSEARLVTLVRKQQMSRCAEIVRNKLITDFRFSPDEVVLGAGISAKSKSGVVEHFQTHMHGEFERRLG